jgi:hypothetical protein
VNDTDNYDPEGMPHIVESHTRVQVQRTALLTGLTVVRYECRECREEYPCRIVTLLRKYNTARRRAEAAEVLVIAVRAAGSWPRYVTGQHGRHCVDCGMQDDLPHRAGCFGVTIAALLDATGTEHADG